jgi:hypothetical protein
VTTPAAAAVSLALAGAFAPLTPELPRGLPDARILGGWERVEGGGELDGLRAEYRFYVDPARPGLYRITKYRVATPVAGAAVAVGAARAAETEKLLWNADPDRRAPLRCWERVKTRSWKTLWLWKAWRWRPLEPGSRRYRHEMGTAVRVYALHRARLGL